MPDKPFVINDRRRFTAEGELRPDAPPIEHHPEPEPEAQPETQPEALAAPGKDAGPRLVTHEPVPAPDDAIVEESASEDPSLAEPAYPPTPTAEQIEQASKAYDATVDRLDTAIRAQNLGSEPPPTMSFERFVQSLYMQAIIQLGGATEPGQPPQVDLLGARQTIDMLGIFDSKSRGNLSEGETKLLDTALFEARMAFLEITQALARQAAVRAGNPDSAPPPPGGPSIVR